MVFWCFFFFLNCQKSLEVKSTEWEQRRRWWAYRSNLFCKMRCDYKIIIVGSEGYGEVSSLNLAMIEIRLCSLWEVNFKANISIELIRDTKIYPERERIIAMHHLTIGIHSEKFVTRRFHCCANVTERTYTNLHGRAWCTPRLRDRACCSWITGLQSTLLYKRTRDQVKHNRKIMPSETQ